MGSDQGSDANALIEYKFEFGDSTHGVLGMVARVRATSREAAVVKLAEYLGESHLEANLPNDGGAVQYCNVYLNGEAVRREHIDEEEPVE